MDKRYFKIIPANSSDAARLAALLGNKTFYPESGSTPALPGVLDNTFNYKQFFIVKGYNTDGSMIVFTRQEYTPVQFGVNVIPTAEWTARYNFSIAPTIEALPTYTEVIDGHSRITQTDIFLNYQYIV